jgi:hypothetical protein
MFTVELYARIRRAVMVDGLSRRDVNRPFIRGCLSTPVTLHCRGQGPFRGLSLMIVFGGGRLYVRSEVRGTRLQPI